MLLRMIPTGLGMTARTSFDTRQWGALLRPWEQQKGLPRI